MIRSVVFANWVLASSALACTTPPGTIPLMSKAADAPLAFAQMDTVPLSAPFTMRILFCDQTLEIEELEFDASMPAHRHGMNFDVDVQKVGGNGFEVSNVVFHMQGLWEIQIDVDVAGQTHAYVGEVSLK